MNNIEYIMGDVCKQPFVTQYRFIPHVCNDIAKMGAGVAKVLYSKWPIIKSTYLNDPIVLGNTQVISVENNTKVFNMIAQHGIMTKYSDLGLPVGNDNRPPIRYAKLVNAMEIIQLYKDIDAEIHCPKFGCGLAGGDWRIVSALIEELWCPYFPVKVCVVE